MGSRIIQWREKVASHLIYPTNPLIVATLDRDANQHFWFFTFPSNLWLAAHFATFAKQPFLGIYFYSHWRKHAQKPKLASMHFLTFSAWPRGIHAYPQTLSLSFKSSLLDYLASSKNWLNIQAGCSLNVLVKLRSRNLDSSSRPTLLPEAMGHTSYSLLVHRVTKPRADSAISYAFRLIWLCVRVFRVRIYYLQYDTADTHSLQKKLFGTLKTRRKLGRVFRKDFWEFY